MGKRNLMDKAKAPGRRPRSRLLSPILAACLGAAGLAPVPLAAAASPTWHPAALRVETIARRLLLANAPRCTALAHDYGFAAAPSGPASWGAAIVMVWPDGPAAAAGLRPGDLVRAANAVPWSADAAERARFDAALGAGAAHAELMLEVERAGQRRRVVLSGRPRCAATVRLSARPVVNAAAMASTIEIGGGLERVLGDDAELAFALAHEAAHVLLGHTAPAGRAALAAPAARGAAEQEADAFALRLMAAAGYDPGAAAGAWLKVADAARPPLHRLLDLHGPYPATAARAAFLMREAARLSAPVPPLLLAARRTR